MSHSPRKRSRYYLRAISIGAVWFIRTAALLLFLVPLALVFWLSFSADNFSAIPPSGYSLRWYRNILQVPQLYEGFLLSLKIAVIVTFVSLIVGTLAAYGQWRYPLLPDRIMENILSLPIMIPLVVIGLSLVIIFSRMGFYSGFWSIVLGHIILTFPFAVRFVSNSLMRYDAQFDEAAASLGARPWQVFWHITLPLVRPGLFAGGFFAFALSFDDFPITIFLVDDKTVPLPVAMYHYMEWNLNPTLSAVSTILLLMAAGLALLIERVAGLDRFVGIRQ